MQLQHIGNFCRFGAIEQIGYVAKEVFTREVPAEHLFLQRTPGPVGEGGVLGIQDAFVEKANHGVDGHLGGLIAVTHGGSIFDRRGNHSAQSGAEGVSILNALNKKAGAKDDSENFLEGQRQIVGLHVLGSRCWRSSHAEVSVMMVSSKAASPKSPGI